MSNSVYSGSESQYLLAQSSNKQSERSNLTQEEIEYRKKLNDIKYIDVIVLGDSILSGHGLTKENKRYNFTNQLAKKLYDLEYNTVRLNDATLPGQTTEVGLSRIDSIINATPKPDIVILALGSNDAFNKVPLEKIYKNLTLIIERLLKEQIKVLLVGVRLPDGSNKDYNGKMLGMYEYLADKYKLELYPNLLSDIIGNPKFTLSDRIHPNLLGIKTLVGNIFTELEKVFYVQHREILRKQRNLREKRRRQSN
jgi:acyl-CoA thioesterase-1